MSRAPAPSEVTHEPWIRTVAQQLVGETTRTGKWMLFTPVDDHDEVWSKIRRATEARELGVAAKAATAMRSPRQARPGALLTCVYTYDYEDLTDVRRVLVALRSLGFGGRLSYKEDDATRSGTYGAGAALYVAQPGALDFEVRREPTEPLVSDPRAEQVEPSFLIREALREDIRGERWADYSLDVDG